jgi:hypothetical protein
MYSGVLQAALAELPMNVAVETEMTVAWRD